MVGDEHYHVVYQGQGGTSVKGSDTQFCLEILEDTYPEDSFTISVDGQTITQYRGKEIVNVFVKA